MADVLGPLEDVLARIQADIPPLAAEDPGIATLKPAPFVHIEHVGPHARNLFSKRGVEPLDDRHHHPDGEDADGDPQGGEQGPEFVGPQGCPGYAQDFDH